jgi:hypothetical protein
MMKTTLTAVLISLALASEAYASYIICLDNNPNGGSISNVGTIDTITVRAYFGQNCTTYNPFTLYPTASSGCWYMENTQPWAPDATQICKITVSTNGSNWLWIDQIELKHGNGDPYWHWGNDDMTGYCISNQSSDGSGTGYCQSNRSFSTFNFVL